MWVFWVGETHKAVTGAADAAPNTERCSLRIKALALLFYKPTGKQFIWLSNRIYRSLIIRVTQETSGGRGTRSDFSERTRWGESERGGRGRKREGRMRVRADTEGGEGSTAAPTGWT